MICVRLYCPALYESAWIWLEFTRLTDVNEHRSILQSWHSVEDFDLSPVDAVTGFDLVLTDSWCCLFVMFNQSLVKGSCCFTNAVFPTVACDVIHPSSFPLWGTTITAGELLYITINRPVNVVIYSYGGREKLNKLINEEKHDFFIVCNPCGTSWKSVFVHWIFDIIQLFFLATVLAVQLCSWQEMWFWGQWKL